MIIRDRYGKPLKPGDRVSFRHPERGYNYSEGKGTVVEVDTTFLRVVVHTDRLIQHTRMFTKEVYFNHVLEHIVSSCYHNNARCFVRPSPRFAGAWLEKLDQD